MLLPNAGKAVIEISKLRDYCLSPNNEVGKHKARVFAAALGLYRQDAMVLRSAILAALNENNAVRGESNKYGQRYLVDFDLVNDGKIATVRSVWIIDHGSDFPRLITCYVL